MSKENTSEKIVKDFLKAKPKGSLEQLFDYAKDNLHKDTLAEGQKTDLERFFVFHTTAAEDKEEKKTLITLRWKDGFVDAVIDGGKPRLLIAVAGKEPRLVDKLCEEDLPETLKSYAGYYAFKTPAELPHLLPRINGIPKKPEPNELFSRVVDAIKLRWQAAHEGDFYVAALAPVASFFQDAARLAVLLRFSGEFGGGKTRGADVVGRLHFRPFFASGSLKPATLFRLVDALRCTLIVNEADAAIGNKEYADEIICLFNSSLEPNHPVPRVDGEARTLRYFDVFGAKVLTTRVSFKDAALESRIIDLPCVEAVEFERFPPALSEADLASLDALRNELYALRVWYGAQPTIRELPAGLPSGRVRQKVAALISALPQEFDGAVNMAITRILESEKDRYSQSEEGEAWSELYELEKAGTAITSQKLCDALGMNSTRATSSLLKRLGWKKPEQDIRIEENGKRVRVWDAPKRVKLKAYKKLGLDSSHLHPDEKKGIFSQSHLEQHPDVPLTQMDNTPPQKMQNEQDMKNEPATVSKWVSGLSGIFQRRKPENEASGQSGTKVLFLKDCPAWVGADGLSYGSFSAGQTVELPATEAEWLIKQGIAQPAQGGNPDA